MRLPKPESPKFMVCGNHPGAISEEHCLVCGIDKAHQHAVEASKL